jgi:hypothetical protein
LDINEGSAAAGLCGEETLLIDEGRQNIEAALEAGWQAFHWTKHNSANIVRSVCT